MILEGIFMGYEVRKAVLTDLEEVSAVERATMGSYTYVDSAWNSFLTEKGDFLCACENGKIIGIAHLAILPDGCGWFEALRVHPDHQNRGVGKALYEKALDLVENLYHCPSFSMYTGRRNVRSMGLAARYGLTVIHDYKEYSLSVTPAETVSEFHYADWQDAERLLLPEKENFGGYLSINRTMYRINSENLRALADRRFCYADDNGNCLVAGSRFQHGSKLFIAMTAGDTDSCLRQVIHLARTLGIPEVTCTFSAVNTQLENALKNNGFRFIGDLITCQRDY